MSRQSAHELVEDVFREYGDALHRYLMRRLASGQNARDLAQKAYLRLLRVEDAALIEAPQAYLFRIASNLVYKFRLQERHKVSRLIPRWPIMRTKRAAARLRMSPPAQAERAQQIKTMLAQLPPLYAVILVMKKRDGKSIQEIASELEISVHTVKNICVAPWRSVAPTEGLPHEEQTVPCAQSQSMDDATGRVESAINARARIRP
jgi:RNA polymerase sigma-70 factor (ECF subfamily)